MNRFGILLLLLMPLLAAPGRCADRPAGRVVWWGNARVSPKDPIPPSTNGVIEINKEILTNAVDVATVAWTSIALKSDGTVAGIIGDPLRKNERLSQVSNIVAIVGDSSFWAINLGSNGSAAKASGLPKPCIIWRSLLTTCACCSSGG